MRNCKWTQKFDNVKISELYVLLNLTYVRTAYKVDTRTFTTTFWCEYYKDRVVQGKARHFCIKPLYM